MMDKVESDIVASLYVPRFVSSKENQTNVLLRKIRNDSDGVISQIELWNTEPKDQAFAELAAAIRGRKDHIADQTNVISPTVESELNETTNRQFAKLSRWLYRFNDCVFCRLTSAINRATPTTAVDQSTVDSATTYDETPPDISNHISFSTDMTYDPNYYEFRYVKVRCTCAHFTAQPIHIP